MANTRTIRSFSLVSWMLIAAGILILLELLLTHVAPSGLDVWLLFLGYAALTIAFVMLFLRRPADLIARIAFIVAAVGWAILAIATVAGVSGLLTVGVILALIGTVVAGILVFVRGLFGRGASVAFLVAAIVAGLLLLSDLVAFLPGTLGTILDVIFGLLLVVTGVLTSRRR